MYVRSGVCVRIGVCGIIVVGCGCVVCVIIVVG